MAAGLAVDSASISRLFRPKWSVSLGANRIIRGFVKDLGRLLVWGLVNGLVNEE
jgi:hypothetical protein